MAGSALVDYAVEHALTCHLEGASLHSCLYVPFGDLNSPEEWFQAQQYGDVKLKLTGEASAGAVKVLIQQLRT